ncbi:tetratricopeptide repeat protein [Candidatus Poribacteria bacterium]|nr:tetratricopeptide repeat protein [Candidatus Poribacteria bacterium]
MQLDDEDKARTTYQRMLERDPDNASTHLILAEIYANHEWIDDAIAAYQKAISLAPGNLDYIEYFGEFYFREGDRAKTLETWNRMVAGDKAVAENYDRLAKLLDSKARVLNSSTEAIAASRKAAELAPDVYRYREALAKRLVENRDYDEALTEYTEAAKLAPNEFFAEQMDNQRIEIYRRQGTLVEKIGALETALEKPDIAAADAFNQYKQLAKMYLKLGNTTYALEVLMKAKALESNDVLVNRWIAEVYILQGRRDDANAIYTYLIEVDSANAREYYTNIARSYLEVMDFDAATDAAKQAIAHSPRNPEGHQMLARIAKQAGNYQTAIDSFKQAIRLRPESTNIRSELAEIYKLSGNPRQALEQYWRCWELSRSITDKLAFVKPLSEVYYDLGRRGELEERLKQMAKTNTSDVGSVVALANLYQMEGDLPNAHFQLARALDRERNNPDLLAQLVKISLDLGDTQDALTYQQRLVKAQPNPMHRQRLGELLFDVGREQEAIQAWTKLLHTKNQPFDAEIKLATLLIQHGLLNEAISVLDRAAEKVTGPNAHLELYQLGDAFVEMNEYNRARPLFQKVLDMPAPLIRGDQGGLPAQNATQNLITNTPHATSGPPGIRTDRFDLPRTLTSRIQRSAFQIQGGRQTQWIPRNFEEAQAGALVQITTIAQQQRQLGELINQLEAQANADPKNIKILETLTQIYILTGNTDKTNETLERLIAASPNDPVYHGTRLTRLIGQGISYETLKKYLDEITALAPDARLWYIARYASNFYRHGRKEDTEKLVVELVDAEVSDLNTGATIVSTLARMGKTDAAEKILTQMSVPGLSTPQRQLAQNTQLPASSVGVGFPNPYASQQWRQYRDIYQNLATAYIREGQTDKGIALFWNFFERTKPQATNARRVATLAYANRSYAGYTSLQTNYPSPTTYYDQNRLQFLQRVFSQLWSRNQQEALYKKLQTELERATRRDRIYPSLALSYCYWWAGQRDDAQEVLAALQKEFPEDLTLKLNTIFAAIQAGQHAAAFKLITGLAEADPRNRKQYHELTLQLAVQTGDTVAVRELVTKVLNSPSGARELYQFSQMLQQNGLTQYAIAIAKKAMTLAIGERDPNFLVDLSQHLDDLGRGQDAARIAARAMQFVNQRDRHGRTLYSWDLRRAVQTAGRAKGLREREPLLVAATQKDPNSFQARVRLATFYEQTNQVQKAAEAFDAALALRPQDTMTRQRYAQMLERRGKAKEAAAQYLILLKANPNALNYNYYQVMQTFFTAGKVDELVSLAKDMIVPSVGLNYSNFFAEGVARQSLENNNPKAAIELYEKIITLQPNNASSYTALAAAYVAAGDREKAIQLLREKLDAKDTTLSRDPHAQVEIVSKLTEFYKASEQIAELLTEYEAKLDEKPDDALLTYLVASMKITADDLEGADTLVDKLLDDSTPVDTHWLNNLADAYRGANDRDRELRLLEATIAKINHQDTRHLTETYQKLGTAYAKKGEKEKAQDTFRKMGTLRLLQGHGSYEKEQIANTYLQHEMWDDAEALFTEIINDFSTQQWTREQAQRQLMQIKQRRDGLAKTTRTPEKTEKFDVGMQRTLAQQYVQQNEVKKAVEIYEKLAEVMPDDLESRAQLANLYSRQNKHDKAVDTWNALLDVDPENTKYQDGLVDSYQAADKTPEALELAQQYIEADTENGVHYARLAKLYAAEDRVDDAIEAYKKAVERNPGDGRVYRQLAQLYLRKDDLDAAEKAFKDAIQYTGQEWERRSIERQLMTVYKRQGKLEEMLKQAEEAGTITLEMQRNRAQDYRNAGEFQKAIEAYKKALDMTTQSYERGNITNELLKLYVQVGDNDLAVELYENQSQSGPMGSFSISSSSSGFKIMTAGDEARETLINAYKNQGKLGQLETIFNDKLEKDAQNPAVLEMVAEIYRNARDYEKAAEAYQALCKAQPSNLNSFFYAAAALQKSNQPELAEKLISQGETAVSTNPRAPFDIFLLMTLASICADGELYDSAVKFAEDAVAASSRMGGGLSSLNEYVYEILGQSYLGAKRYEEAVDAYKQMANIARFDQGRERAEAAIRQAYTEGKLYEKQIPEQLQKIKENPDDLDAHFTLAESYELGDKVDEAIAQYQKISELQPDDAQWHKKIGDLYQKHRQTEKIVEDTALDLAGNGSFVEITDSAALNNISQQVTLTAWIKPIEYPNRYTPILYKGDERTPEISNRSYTLWLRNDGTIQFAASPSGEAERGVYSPPGSVTLNKWYHVAGVIDAPRNFIKLFIDGAEVGTRDFRGNQNIYESNLPVRIGGSHEEEWVTHASFIGQIDRVAVWDVALTADEIRSNMNTRLKGDEPGLVAYWEFDGEMEGHIPDASPNKNNGRLVGEAKLEPYTRRIVTVADVEQLTQAAAAYQKAIQLEPTSYELYNLLAQTHVKADRLLEAEAVYRQALDASLEESENNAVVRSIWKLYADKDQKDKGIAVLEELRPKMGTSTSLLELLGDAYKAAGDAEKADAAYTEWLTIQEKNANRRQSPAGYRNLARQILDKGIMPEKGLEYAERASQMGSGASYTETLAQAYVANDRYEEALAQLKQRLNTMEPEAFGRWLSSWIARAGKNAMDKGRYVEMLDQLMNTMSDNLGIQLDINLKLAEFCRENAMPEKAKTYVQKTGVIAEDSWLILGPFDNTKGVGYDTAYIPEDATQIDTTAKYDAVDGRISWQRSTDDTLNGFIDLGQDVNWRVAYAFVTVTSPDEREAQIRFDSDDQGKVFLNGKEVFTNTGAHSVRIDRYTIPVTLKPGENSILVKVCNEEVNWEFYLRITDPDGKPFTDLKISSPDPEPR